MTRSAIVDGGFSMNYSRGEPSFGYIDAATGKKLWSKGTGQKPMSAPVIAEGAIYFIADDGKVHAVK